MADLVEQSEAQVLFNLINNSDRQPRNLSGGSANFIWSIDAGPASTSPMSIVDPTQGRVSYRFLPSELVPGVLRGDVESTDSNGDTVIARDIVRLQVRRRIS